MKKHSVILSTMLAATLCFVACQKDDEYQPSGCEFTASAQGYQSDSKTILVDDVNLHWENIDSVMIFGNYTDGNTALSEAERSGQVRGYYRPKQIAPNGNRRYTTLAQTGGTSDYDIFRNQGNHNFYALYPAGNVLNHKSIKLPQIQTSENGRLTYYPMCAVTQPTGTGSNAVPSRELHFMNLCGILKIHLSAQDAINIKAIKLTGATMTGMAKMNIEEHTSGGGFLPGWGGGTTTYDTTYSYDNSTANAILCGNYAIHFDDMTSEFWEDPMIYNTGAGSNELTLKLKTPQSIDTIDGGHDFYMYLPQATYYNLQICFDASNAADKTITVPVVDIKTNYITLINATNLQFEEGEDDDDDDDDEIVRGAFPINNTDWVYFAPGNLQFNASVGNHTTADEQTLDGTWRFAEHQYDYIGTANMNAAEDYEGWIDLFCWGTSGWNSRTTTPSYYQPWHMASGRSDNDRTQNATCFGPNGANDLTGDFAYSDWGIYNTIKNYALTESYAPGTWRTLTQDEWDYLLDHSKHGLGTVAGVKGLILLPTPYNGPALQSVDNGGTFSTGSGHPSTYDANTITEADWAIMEQYGAVFLPCTGQRGIYGGNTDYRNHGNSGDYWSTTHYTNGNGNYRNSHAYYVAFEENGINYHNNQTTQSYYLTSSWNHLRNIARCVRLVCAAPAPTTTSK